MSAYMICDVSVRDRGKLIEYLDLAKGSVELFGGKYLAQAGKISVYEGDWDPQTIVVVEFPTADDAQRWYQSDHYAAALMVKPQAMVRNMIVVNGLSE